jgi:hypothetical protein
MARPSDPTPTVRNGVYDRELWACISCGRRDHLEFQHRRRVGAGGSKVRPLFVDGLTSCVDCNGRYESDLQRQALEFGWKVRSWVRDTGLVPVFSWVERRWFRLTRTGGRVEIGQETAMEMMQHVYGDAYVPGRGVVS